MGSRFSGSDSTGNSSHSFNFNMEAIKKKMQAMKVEKDNACDQADVSEEKMVAAVAKLDKAGTAADDSERAKKVFQSKADEDEKRIIGLEKAEERADVGETEILELEEELRVVANNLKSLEVAEEKANQREKTYKEQIKTLTAKLKQAEARAEFAEKSVQKLQKEVDRLEDELVAEQEKFKAITEELEQTFAEMSGY